MRESASDWGVPEALGSRLPLLRQEVFLVARTGSVAFDQLVEKGERQLIRFVIRWCSHDCLTEHLRQPTLFEGGKACERVKRNQIGP